jgi:hypothetical protein
MVKAICSIQDCEDPAVARGWCWKHYKRWQRRGSTDAPPRVSREPRERRTKPAADRFWPKVSKTETCWLWTAGANNMGYGLFWSGGARSQGRRLLAHRFAYELLVGPIPDGLTIDHLCRVPLCCRPDHLEPVTMRENLRRGNGWSGRKARQTHCLRGHALTEDNIYRRPSKPTARECRICMVEREARRVRKER